MDSAATHRLVPLPRSLLAPLSARDKADELLGSLLWQLIIRQSRFLRPLLGFYDFNDFVNAAKRAILVGIPDVTGAKHCLATC